MSGGPRRIPWSMTWGETGGEDSPLFRRSLPQRTSYLLKDYMINRCYSLLFNGLYRRAWRNATYFLILATILHKSWGSQSWLPPAFSRRLRLRRRLRARLPNEIGRA